MELGRERGKRKIRRGEEAYMEIMMSLPLTQYPPRNLTTYLKASETVVFHGNNAQDNYIST